MSEKLLWAFVALAALFIYLVYRLLGIYLHLRVNMRQREMLYKERLSAIAKGQPPPGGDALEAECRESLWHRFAAAPGVKIACFIAAMALGSGSGVWAGFSLLPDRLTLHDYWSLGLIGIALGLGLLGYTLFSKKLTRAAIAERKLD